MTDTVRASSSAKDEASPSMFGARAGAGAGARASAGAGVGADASAGAGAGAGAGAPKKSARGKSSAFFSGFCLVQVKTPVTKEVDKSATTCFAAATAVATV